jgi:hypothetical protein
MYVKYCWETILIRFQIICSQISHRFCSAFFVNELPSLINELLTLPHEIPQITVFTTLDTILLHEIPRDIIFKRCVVE